MSKVLPLVAWAVGQPSLGESTNEVVGTWKLVSTDVDVSALVCGTTPQMVGGKP
jgi:hypothetical protein